MKKTVLLFALFFSFGSRVSAQAVFPNADSVVNYLKGNWVWLRSCGGFAGGCSTPSTTGNTQNIIFTKVPGFNDSIAYKVYLNGNLTNSDASKVVYGSSMYSGWWTFRLNSYPASSVQMKVSLYAAKPDSIWMNDNCWDCYQRSFVRNINPVGLNAQKGALQLQLYPNPAHAELWVSLANTEATLFHITDINGKEQLTGTLQDARIDLSALGSGIYFIRVSNSSGSYKGSFIRE